MTSLTDLRSDLKTREQALRRLCAEDPQAALAAARELANDFGGALANFPDQGYLAAGWLRCLRRCEAPWREVAPAIETALVRFPQDPWVVSGACFLEIDAARERLTQDDVLGAAMRLECTLQRLPALAQPGFVALGLLPVLSAFAERLHGGRGHSAPDANQGLERVVIALTAVLETWLGALPMHTEIAHERGNSEHEALPARLRGLYLVRRLLKLAGRHETLWRSMEAARTSGIADEWLADAEVESLAALDRLEEALALVTALRARHPDSEALARRRVDLLRRLGRVAEAQQMAEVVALGSRSPWPWRDWARLQIEQGDAQTATATLRAALAWQDPREPGPVWELHFRLAEILLQAGDEPGAAEELWLAREARLRAGWGIGKDLQALVAVHGLRLRPLLAPMDTATAGEVRRRALLRYHDAHAGLCRSRAVAGVVAAVRPRFAFLRLTGFREDVYCPLRIVPRGMRLEPGMDIEALALPSVDPRTSKPSFRAVWVAEQRKGVRPAGTAGHRS